MKNASALLRSLAALVAGLVVISLFVEALEMALVTLVAGEVVSDPTEYFAIRNRPLFLAAKLLYNTAGAALGGMLVVVVAGRRPLLHATLLAGIQTLAFVWALSTPELRSTGPLWMWLALIPLSVGGIVVGAISMQRRRFTPQ